VACLTVSVLCDPPNNNIAGGIFSLGSTVSEVYTYFNPEGPSTRIHPYNVNDYGMSQTISSTITCYYNSTFPKVAVVYSSGKRFTLQGHALVDSDGNKAAYESTKFTLTTATVTMGTVTGFNLTYATTFTVNAIAVTFQKSIVVWMNSGSVTVDGMTFSVLAGDTKTTWSIVNWPFQTALSRLIYAVFVNSNGAGAALQAYASGDLGYKYSLGSMVYTVPLTAYNNSNLVSINGSMWIDGTSGTTIQSLTAYAFPKSTHILYDPLSTVSGALSVGPVTLFILAVVLILSIVLA